MSPAPSETTAAADPEGLGPHRMALSYGQFSTEVQLSDGSDYALKQQQIVASWSMSLGDGWSIGASAGGVLDGSLRGKPTRYDVQPGFVLAARGTKVWIEDESWWPFVATSVAVAVGYVPLKATDPGGGPDADLVTTDLRADVTVGKRVAGFLVPYLSVRAFGAPLFLVGAETLSGSDPHHYQVAVGAQLAFPRGVAAFVDWSPFGERSLSFGLSWAL